MDTTEPLANNRHIVRKMTLADDRDSTLADYADFSPAERFLMARQLTINAWQFKDREALLRPCLRHVVKVIRN